jgi:hypothetical protein
VGKRSRRRSAAATAITETVDYTDADGNVLTLRRTNAKLPEPAASAAASAEDLWHRRNEMRFERLAVRWVIAGLPIEKQKELLARYRMADRATQDWVQRTIDGHLDAA